MRGHTHVTVDDEDHFVAECIEVDGANHTHRVRTGCGLTIDVSEAMEPPGLRSRWKSLSSASCSWCIRIESDTPMDPHHVHPVDRITTVHADIPTGLPCPHGGCAAQLYIRRRNGSVACSAQGHEYTVPEVLATSMGLLRRLADMTTKEQ